MFSDAEPIPIVQVPEINGDINSIAAFQRIIYQSINLILERLEFLGRVTFSVVIRFYGGTDKPERVFRLLMASFTSAYRRRAKDTHPSTHKYTECEGGSKQGQQ